MKTWQGIWRLIDPKITMASAASMLLGAALAFRRGPIAWGWLVMTVLGIFCIEAAKNASGEIFDWDSGDDQAVAEEDRTPFSGGKRVLVDRLLTRRQTWMVALGGYLLGAACGLAIVIGREPRVLAVGIVGVAMAFFYHAPPLKLSYRGLGELAVALTYGPLVCAGTYLVQRHQLPLDVVLASLPLALAIACFLWICEFPDRRADEKSGKRTWVVRLGAVRASHLFAGFEAAVWIGVALLPLFGLPPAFWLGLAGMPFAYAAARRLESAPEVTTRIIPAQGWTLLAFVLLSLGSSLGLVLSR
jgi:1,4-dihydroxy-2-naphthoate octaprenyltransferase